MFYVYVLQSKKDEELYIGSTNNLRRRVEEHNSGMSFATKPRKPLSVVYYEAYSAEGDARRREKSLKLRGQARRQLLSRISGSLLRDAS